VSPTPTTSLYHVPHIVGAAVDNTSRGKTSKVEQSERIDFFMAPAKPQVSITASQREPHGLPRAASTVQPEAQRHFCQIETLTSPCIERDTDRVRERETISEKEEAGVGERPPRTRVRKLELILPSVRRQAALGSMTVVRWRLQSMSRAEPSHKELPRRKSVQNLDVRVFSVSRGHSLSLFFALSLFHCFLSRSFESSSTRAFRELTNSVCFTSNFNRKSLVFQRCGRRANLLHARQICLAREFMNSVTASTTHSIFKFTTKNASA